MTEKKRIELTKLQGIIAVASFSSGVLIAVVCLFWIPPLGEIANSAISIVSELLVLCGAILGVKASYDTSSGSLKPNSIRSSRTKPKLRINLNL